MSRKISNILVICAMVVIFPLLIVGTSFAAYYSINATTKISFYVINATSQEQSAAKEAGASMSVVYNNKDHAEDFEVTNSHVKEIVLKPTAEHYTFVGWYNGTAEDYNNAVEKKYIEEGVENGNLTTKLSTYKNLLAIYEIEEYEVEYSYNANPEDTAEVSTTAPSGASETYKYGATLYTLPVPAGVHYTFNGWNVNGKLYTKATFDKAAGYTLSATPANGAWTENAKFTVNYVVDGDVFDSATEYVGSTLTLKNVSETGKTPEAGEKFVWVDTNGNRVTTATTNTTVILTAVGLDYTVRVNNGEDIVYTGSSKTFSYGETNALEDLYKNNNYSTEYSFWKIGSLTFNGTSYDKAGELQTAIQAANPNADAQVEVTANVVKHFTNVTVTTVNFRSSNGYDYSESVYIAVNDAIPSTNISSTASTLEITKWLQLEDGEGNVRAFYSDAGATTEVTLSTIMVKVENKGSYVTIDANEVTTINDLIEVVYNEIELADKDSLTFESITLRFE